jgi:hypothetical protein
MSLDASGLLCIARLLATDCILWKKFDDDFELAMN